MASIKDGLVDSPFGRVRPEILNILNGGQSAPAPVAEETTGGLSAFRGETPQGNPTGSAAAPVVSNPNDFSSAVGRGANQLQAAGGGFIETIGQATGSQYLKDLGGSIREEQTEQAKAYGTPEYASSSDITDPFDMDQVGQYLKNQVGQLAPQIAAVGGASAVMARAPGFAGLIGKSAAAASAAFLTSFGINTGAIQNELKELDPQGEHPMTALAFGSAAGVMDAVGFGVMAKPLMKYISPETIYMHALASGIPAKTAMDGLKSVATGVAAGGITGGATDAAQAYIAGEATDKPYSTEQILHRAVDSALGGAIAGGGARVGAEILDRVTANAMAPNSAVTPDQLKSGSTKEHGLLSQLWDMTSREATAPLDPLARVSPEIDSIIRDFRPDMTGKTATGETVHERYEILSGTLHTQFEDVLKKMSTPEKDAMFADLVKPADQMTNPAAKKVRGILDDVWNKADNADLQVGRVEGYMPDTLDVDAIKANRQQFEQDIAPYIEDPVAVTNEFLANAENPRDTDAVPAIDQLVQPGMTPDQLQIMARYTKGGDPDTMRGKFAQGTVPPKNSNLEFTRAFNAVPQEVRTKWVKEKTAKEKEGAINDYLHGAAHRIAFAERFGPSGEVLNARIAKGVYEAQQAGRNVSKAEVSQLYGIADAYNGMYKRLQSKNIRNAYTIGMTALNMKTLPFAAIMSLTELGTPMLRFNVADTLSSIGPAMYQVANGALSKAFKGVPRSEWAQLAGEAGIDWNSTQNLVGERLGATMYNRAAAKANRLFFMANGLSALTHAQRTLAAMTGKRVYTKELGLLAAGLDMTSSRGAYALNQLRSLGVDVKTRADAEKLYSPSTPSEIARAREVERLMVRRAASQSILEPTSSDLPLWMSSGAAAPLAQLKKYPTAYTNIILPQLIRRMKPSYQGSYTGALAATMGTAFTVGLMYYMGSIQDYLSRYAKAGFTEPEDDRTDGQIMYDITSRTFTPMGLQYLTGMLESSRYGQGPVESQLGPWAGLAADAARAANKTISSFEDDPTSGYVWQFLFKQTPFGQSKPLQQSLKDTFDME